MYRRFAPLLLQQAERGLGVNESAPGSRRPKRYSRPSSSANGSPSMSKNRSPGRRHRQRREAAIRRRAHRRRSAPARGARTTDGRLRFPWTWIRACSRTRVSDSRDDPLTSTATGSCQRAELLQRGDAGTRQQAALVPGDAGHERQVVVGTTPRIADDPPAADVAVLDRIRVGRSAAGRPRRLPRPALRTASSMPGRTRRSRRPDAVPRLASLPPSATSTCPGMHPGSAPAGRRRCTTAAERSRGPRDRELRVGRPRSCSRRARWARRREAGSPRIRATGRRRRRPGR